MSRKSRKAKRTDRKFSKPSTVHHRTIGGRFTEPRKPQTYTTPQTLTPHRRKTTRLVAENNFASFGQPVQRAPVIAQGVNRQARTSTPVNIPDHIIVNGQPKPQGQKQTTKNLGKPATRSLSAREALKKTVCKKRPDKLAPRRPGGGASKSFVPWC